MCAIWYDLINGLSDRLWESAFGVKSTGARKQSRFLKLLVSKCFLSSAHADTSEFQPFAKNEIK